MEKLLAIAISWAALLSPYDAFPPEELHVVTIDQKTMIEYACLEVTPCPVYGWYDYGDAIYIVEGVEKHPRFLGLLVHEVVHYMQIQQNGFPKDCADSLEMEREAYRVQDDYLVQNGVRPPMRLTFAVRCSTGHQFKEGK